MDMKLNHRLIKELRLKNSWSQEKLADIANVNPRTIQRVEADGTGSLQTRARLAQAFSIEPSALDVAEPHSLDLPAAAGSEELSAPKAISAFRNYSHLPILLLITCIYLAWTPIFFDLSRISFFSGEFVQLYRGPGIGLSLAIVAGMWIVLSALWLAFVFRKKRAALYLHAGYLLIPLIAGAGRVWLPEPTMYLVSFALYASGLALLLASYKPRLDDKRIKHAVNISLVTYVFLWCFHSTLFNFAGAAVFSWQNGLELHAPWISFGTFLVRTLSTVAYLLPVILVMLFAMGRDRYSTNNPGNMFLSGLNGLKKWFTNSSQGKDLSAKELA